MALSGSRAKSWRDCCDSTISGWDMFEPIYLIGELLNPLCYSTTITQDERPARSFCILLSIQKYELGSLLKEHEWNTRFPLSREWQKCRSRDDGWKYLLFVARLKHDVSVATFAHRLGFYAIFGSKFMYNSPIGCVHWFEFHGFFVVAYLLYPFFGFVA